MGSLNAMLMGELIRGCDRLSASSRNSVSDFVLSRESPSGGFMDRAGRPDVYYTFFGLASAFALGLRLNDSHKRFLEAIDPSTLDLPNYAAYMGSLGLSRYFSLPKKMRSVLVRSAARLPLRAKKNPLTKKFPLTPESSPYTIFLSLMGSAISADDRGPILDARERIDAFHVDSGGWSNIKGNSEASLNATAAVLAMFGHARVKVDENDIKWLKAQQLPLGGFLSSSKAPLPDLLSTATALAALKMTGEKPDYPTVDFIQFHWRSDGGFASTFMDEKTDCEYTFYGLLALGASHR